MLAAGAGARVAVGFDGRLSSPAPADALTRGLHDGGARVLAIGLGPTGMLYHAVHAHGCHAGVMVTGSHNPPDQNGFKTVIAGEPVYGAALTQAGLAVTVAEVVDDRKRGLVARLARTEGVDEAAVTTCLGQFAGPWEWA